MPLCLFCYLDKTTKPFSLSQQLSLLLTFSISLMYPTTHTQNPFSLLHTVPLTPKLPPKPPSSQPSSLPAPTPIPNMCIHTHYYYICGCVAYTLVRHRCEYADVHFTSHALNYGYSHVITMNRGSVNENCAKHPSTGETFVESGKLGLGKEGGVVMGWRF